MEVRNIPIGDIAVSPLNPRKAFDAEALQELAENIKEQGLLQPLTVRPSWKCTDPSHGAKYELVCGERRFRALSILHAEDPSLYAEVPAIIKEIDDREALENMVAENLQRKDILPSEEASAFSALLDAGSSAEEIAARFGKSKGFVDGRVKLASLLPGLVSLVDGGDMDITAGVLIAKLGKEDQERFLKEYSRRIDCGMHISRKEAALYAESLFSRVSSAPWMTDDEDYEGPCEKACRDCPRNTQNAGCLFDELREDEGTFGRCTDMEMYEAKHVAYLLHTLRNNSGKMTRVGEKPSSGKLAVIDNSESWWSFEKKEKVREITHAIRMEGFEVFMPSDFAGREWTPARGADMMDEGKAVGCIDPFDSHLAPKPRITYWRLKEDETQKSQEEDGDKYVDSKVMSLTNIYSICKRKADAVYHNAIERAAGKTDISKMDGPLDDNEQLAFDIWLQAMNDNPLTAINAPLDERKRNRIFRALVQKHHSTADEIYENILSAWNPEALEKARDRHMNDIAELEPYREQLHALGYDVDGKKIDK